MANVKEGKCVGRPACSDDLRAKPVSIRLNRSQREMLKILGGVGWIRSKIDDELSGSNA